MQSYLLCEAWCFSVSVGFVSAEALLCEARCFSVSAVASFIIFLQGVSEKAYLMECPVSLVFSNSAM